MPAIRIGLANARLDRIDEALIEKFIHHRRKQLVRRKKDAKKYVTPATVNRDPAGA
jgi:hypothetical protein